MTNYVLLERRQVLQHKVVIKLGKMFLVRFVMYSVGYAREKSAAAVKRDKGDNVKAL